MAENHLIVFVKNPVPGTVKTRIAQTVGNERAAVVYRHLLRYTQQVTQTLLDHCVVYYGDFVNANDGWNGYEKRLQTGSDLGQRMLHAFEEQFEMGAQRIVIIGSDCLTITADHVRLAFDVLTNADVVIGPATDGGYYLLGMKQLNQFLFENMPWSQPELRQLTELTLSQHGLTFGRLEELSDIDTWDDYQTALQ